MSKLKSGYTTGTCAAIAAKAAVKMIFTQKMVSTEYIITPPGTKIETEIRHAEIRRNSAKCAVKKYSGDDPDITNGILVYAEAELCDGDIKIDGGEGVGRITKPGLDQPVGAAAINSVPRKMIQDAVTEVLEENGAECGAAILISIPEGKELAKKTFNPRLGIEGGISVLGTSGIVEPMSTRAILDTIDVELNFRKSNGRSYAIIAPGNYGRDFVHERMGIDIDAAVKCSNYIGDTIDMVREKQYKGLFLIGHVGKLVKLAAGIMNTHSRVADGRMEIFCAHAALCGASAETAEQIMAAVTTDDVIAVLKAHQLLEPVMNSIKARMEFYLGKRCDGMPYAFVMFSNVHGELCRGGDIKIIERAVQEVKE